MTEEVFGKEIPEIIMGGIRKNPKNFGVENLKKTRKKYPKESQEKTQEEFSWFYSGGILEGINEEIPVKTQKDMYNKISGEMNVEPGGVFWKIIDKKFGIISEEISGKLPESFSIWNSGTILWPLSNNLKEFLEESIIVCMPLQEFLKKKHFK